MACRLWGRASGWAFMAMFVGELADFRRRVAPEEAQPAVVKAAVVKAEVKVKVEEPVTPPGAAGVKRRRLGLRPGLRSGTPGALQF